VKLDTEFPFNCVRIWTKGDVVRDVLRFTVESAAEEQFISTGSEVAEVALE